jgi:hypothetical protein
LRQQIDRTGILYGCLIFFLALWVLVVFLEPIRNAVPETDSWWMVPVFAHFLEGESSLERLLLALSRPLNFIHAPGGENLAESAAQRAAAIAHLDAALEAVLPLHAGVPDEPYGQYVKPRG